MHKEGFLGQTGVSTGSFLIDSTLGRDTQFGIYVEDEEDHLIKSIRFTDSKGKTYGPFHRMSSDFDLINFKTINFPAGQSPPFSAVSFTFCKIFLHPFNAPWYVFLQLVWSEIFNIIHIPYNGIFHNKRCYEMTNSLVLLVLPLQRFIVSCTHFGLN